MTRFVSLAACALAALSLAVPATLWPAHSYATDIERDRLTIERFVAPDVSDAGMQASRADVIVLEPIDCAKVACVALTFDDGPDPAHTPRILSILQRHEAHGTFFVVGSRAAAHPNLIQDELRGGHVVASHTFNHPNLTNLSEEALTSELDRTDEAISRAVKADPSLGTSIIGLNFGAKKVEKDEEENADAEETTETEEVFTSQFIRPPYGAANHSVYAKLSERGMTPILWDVDTEDWRNRSAKVSTQRVHASIKPGSIILFHDIHPVAEQALDQLISDLRYKGYYFVTVDKLLDGKRAPGQPVIQRATLLPN